MKELDTYPANVDVYSTFADTKFSGCTPPDGNMYLNDNPKIRIFEVVGNENVSIYYQYDGKVWNIVRDEKVSLRSFINLFSVMNSPLKNDLYHVEVKNNQVITIEEIFRP